MRRAAVDPTDTMASGTGRTEGAPAELPEQRSDADWAKQSDFPRR